MIDASHLIDASRMMAAAPPRVIVVAHPYAAGWVESHESRSQRRRQRLRKVAVRKSKAATEDLVVTYPFLRNESVIQSGCESMHGVVSDFDRVEEKLDVLSGFVFVLGQLLQQCV